MRTIVFTLTYNLCTEVEKAVMGLYKLNDTSKFKHIICDVGFPLECTDKIPASFDEAKNRNSEKLKLLAEKYGSIYIKIKNEGVSQNWNSIIKYVDLQADDVIIGLDPDELCLDKDWVSAMSDVLRSDKIGMCCLMQPDHEQYAYSWAKEDKVISGINCYLMKGVITWALIGFNGKFLREIGLVPIPDIADTYGYIEYALYPLFEKYGYDYVCLPNHRVQHTISSQLFEDWKRMIVKDKTTRKQMPFEQYLESIRIRQ